MNPFLLTYLHTISILVKRIIIGTSYH
jgi:hypothetical protein